MQAVLNDRVQETTQTDGEADFVLAGAPLGYQPFATAIGDGNFTFYAAIGYTASGGLSGEWEVGVGQVTIATGTTTLVRATVISSSAGGAKVAFNPGTKQVFNSVPASHWVWVNPDGTLGGAQLPPAAAWIVGAGAPANEDGKIGDLALDTDTGDVYAKTDVDTWTLQVNIKGPPGASGGVTEDAGAPLADGSLVEGTATPGEVADSGIAAADVGAHLADTGNPHVVDAVDVGLGSVENGADITDADNVAAAGAVMDDDISAAEGMLRKTGSGAYEGIKSNLGATVDPTVNEDSGDGYAVGSLWINTTDDKVFQATDVTVGAAVWKELSAGGGGGGAAPVTQVFTSSGTYTPTSGMVSCFVHLVGGGGAGGDADDTDSAAGGGAAGGTAMKMITAAAIGASQTVTIGAAGTGTGGTTSLGALLSATGGTQGADNGGWISGAVVGPGGVGGSGSGGDINIDGQAGNSGVRGAGSANSGVGGTGGCSTLGGGGLGGKGSVGAVGGNYGAGGGGGDTGGTGNLDGGNGAAGVILIVEYF